MDTSLYDTAARAAEYVKAHTSYRPETAVILGSGLGELADEFADADVIPYADIPGFPPSAVAGHAARMVIGRISGRIVAAMQGRFHFYEGLTMREVAFPVYVLRLMGVREIIITNACGGINPSFTPGDLMLITDHINLTGHNPLIGANDERFGPRFPDMTEVYDRQYIGQAENAAARLGIPLRRGVYAFFSGPCFETAAEIRAYAALGADTVGMSTVPEAAVACYLGMRVLGISCITNMATGISAVKHSHKDVLAAAETAGKRFRDLIRGVLRELPE